MIFLTFSVIYIDFSWFDMSTMLMVPYLQKPCLLVIERNNGEPRHYPYIRCSSHNAAVSGFDRRYENNLFTWI